MKKAVSKLSISKITRNKALSEVIMAARFGVVGVVATIVHVIIVSILLWQTSWHILLTNTIAFFIAFWISFAGNYIWTFHSSGSPKAAMARFLLISISAFLVNTIILKTILDAGLLPPISATILSAIAIPVITFTASRFWAFQFYDADKR